MSNNSCSVCNSNKCCCSTNHKNINRIQNNPTNTNTINQTINIQPIWNFSPSNGEGGDITVTSGPLFRNVNTEFIAVSALNVSNSPQTITVSVIDWNNTCDENEFPKFGFLSGDLIQDNGNSVSTQQNENSDTFFPPIKGTGVLTPFTFTIPPRQLLTVQAFPPSPAHPPNPCYEIRVTYPPSPFFSPSTVFPSAPIRVNAWGISFEGVIQEGNTVLHHQFTVT